jgi:hypothetical protein
MNRYRYVRSLGEHRNQTLTVLILLVHDYQRSWEKKKRFENQRFQSMSKR